MATMKFKIGDKVIGNHPTRYAYTKLGWKGIVTDVRPNGYFTAKGDGNPAHNGTFAGLEPMYFDLIPTNEKIVITHDGKVTTATMYGVMGNKTTATARCAPEDKFDFAIGAKLAMERLMNKIDAPTNYEWRVVNRKPKVGDYIRLKTSGGYSFSKSGDILKIDNIGLSDIVRVYGKNHIRDTGDPNFIWSYTEDEYEVVEKVTTIEPKKPEPPKYFNGKVVCINAPAGWWTKGKIYSVVNGTIIDDDGDKRYEPEPITPKFEGMYGLMFLPIVEDNEKPLTIEELNKMDGQKVWLVSLNSDKKPYEDNYLGGWHTVDIKKKRLFDDDGRYYPIEDNNTEFGFLAYRQAPSK